MPKKPNLSKKMAAEKKNRGAVDSAIYGEEEIEVGCVIKSLGNGGFSIQLKDGKEVSGLIRGVLKGGRNSAAYVTAGAWVVLAPNNSGSYSHDRPMMQEILGVVKDRRAFKELQKAGLIEATAIVKEDDGFEFDYTEQEAKEEQEDEESGKRERVRERGAGREMGKAEIDAI